MRVLLQVALKQASVLVQLEQQLCESIPRARGRHRHHCDTVAFTTPKVDLGTVHGTYSCNPTRKRDKKRCLRLRSQLCLSKASCLSRVQRLQQLACRQPTESCTSALCHFGRKLPASLFLSHYQQGIQSSNSFPAPSKTLSDVFGNLLI